MEKKLGRNIGYRILPFMLNKPTEKEICLCVHVMLSEGIQEKSIGGSCLWKSNWVVVKIISS